MSAFAPMPDPPYYAVIFSTKVTNNLDGYPEMAEKMEALAQGQPGYIGIESARETAGIGITVSYWQSEEAVLNWKAVAGHMLAQKVGKERWYDHYVLRVAKVERQYDGPEGR
ncbi:MAG: antibiotic biosynthesis monooxygenase [Paracoccaceae bacterium]|jgi:heme-degrading monooxygenase HmoA|nr:antibiotic biosynthesis monooxygenase [Paracoccaceae bacterium]